MHDTTKLFLAIALFALPTVAFGGFSLLRLKVGRRLNDFQSAYFRAGHAHAGVLLILTLVVVDLLDRIGAGYGWRVLAGACLVLGALAQSGGMFLHMAVGAPGRWSVGNSLTTAGAVLVGAGLVTAGFTVLAA
jgi:hypothetical protein